MDNQIELSVGDFTTVQIHRNGPTSVISTVSGNLLAKLLGRRWKLVSSKLEDGRTTLILERGPKCQV